MEFLDEDARPRVTFQSKPLPLSSSSSDDPKARRQIQFNNPFLILTLSLSSLSLASSIFYLETEPLRSLAFWFSLSFLVGPFAPPRITGGNCRVGEGPTLELLPEEEEEEKQEEERSSLLAEKRGSRRRSKPVRTEEAADSVGPGSGFVNGSLEKPKRNDLSGSGSVPEEEKGWNEEDLGLLKKQMAKHPVGKPGRWEAVAGAFNGSHRVESVIKKAKEMGEMKVGEGGGDYEKFLKNRKPVDERVQEEIEANGNGGGGGGGGWVAGEDIALLNALKAFPKETTMRWEKISAAVPGRSKAACMRRVSELKKDFRSSKASNI